MKVVVNPLLISKLAYAIMLLMVSIKVARFTLLRYLVLLIQVAQGDVEYQRVNPLCYYATYFSKKDEKGQLGRQSGEKDKPNRTFSK